MKDNKGHERRVIYLGEINGKEFEEEYNRLAQTENIIPVASTLIRVMLDNNKPEMDVDGEYVFNAWIYYEFVPPKNQEPIKLNL